jgi:hypothetical protein
VSAWGHRQGDRVSEPIRFPYYLPHAFWDPMKSHALRIFCGFCVMFLRSFFVMMAGWTSAIQNIVAAPNTPAVITANNVDSLVALDGTRHIATGMPRQQVVALIDAPGAILDQNVWVYWNYKAVGIPGTEKYDTLIVVFKDGRINLIQFCRSEPVRAFIAAQGSIVAAKGTKK